MRMSKMKNTPPYFGNKKILETFSMKSICAGFFVVGLVLVGSKNASAASGEMGTGVPILFGNYSSVAFPSQGTNVWALSEATIGFPAGCTSIRITRATMGVDDYKIAMATMLIARTTKRKIRFYAHADRDGGCGVDYIQLTD